jgi:membrane protein DedA with SNARE-associated domain
VTALLRSLKPAAPALLYVAGMVPLVIAGFLFAAIAGCVALGVALIVLGYMAEVNQ